MSASSAAAVQLPETGRKYHGWLVVLAAYCGVMVGFGSLLVFTFSVFLKPLSAEFGWSREAVSRAFGLAAISVAICSPKLGQWLDRYGPLRIILPCMTIFGLVLASLAWLTPHLAHLYAVFVLMGVVGNGTTQMGYSRAVSTWFDRRRGLALSLVMAGVGTGSILLPPLAQAIITSAGWRTAYLVLGALVLLLGIPLTAVFVRERKDPGDSLSRAAEVNASVREGLQSRVFWIIMGMLFLSSVSINGAVTHLSALLTDRGISARDAALAASVMGGASFFSRLGTGWLLDRFFGARVAFLLLCATAGGILLLSATTSPWTATAAAALIGVGMGGEADITPYLLSRYFGLRSFSTLYGFSWTAYALAGAIGPVIMGRVFDITGSYTRLLVLLALSTLVAGFLALLMPRYKNHAE